jgi:adenosylhomocysteinase
VENAGKLDAMLIDVPVQVDQDVASRKLAFMGKKIDTLTEEQIAYLNS